MTSMGFHVSNLPSGAVNIILLIKNQGEANIRREIQQPVWPSGYTYTSFPQLPYLNWGPTLEVKYIAVKSNGEPVGGFHNFGWEGASGDFNWVIQYGGPAHLNADVPNRDFPFAKITKFNLPEEVLAGGDIDISATIKNTSPTAGYVYARFKAFTLEEVDLGQDLPYVWLEPDEEVTFSPELTIQMPSNFPPGSIVLVTVQSFVAAPGVWYGAEFSDMVVWTGAEPEPEPEPEPSLFEQYKQRIEDATTVEELVVIRNEAVEDWMNSQLTTAELQILLNLIQEKIDLLEPKPPLSEFRNLTAVFG